MSNQSKANKLLEGVLGIEQLQEKPPGLRGILQTKNYSDFIILSDGGNEIQRFSGAKLANKCLPGDHVFWSEGKCHLELRDSQPPIVGTVELVNKSKYGLTSRGIPIYLFTPYNKSYPHFIVGCSEKDVSRNRIGLVNFDDWSASSTFPRGQLQQLLGVSGDFEAEKEALMWQACPWKHPKGTYTPEVKETTSVVRKELTGFTFNIDPKGCKDVDDVLTFEEIETTTGVVWRISITISDVAAYIELDSPVDIYASLIGQTLYDVTGTPLRPMLPKEYSEEFCSLIPNKTSLGITLQFIWNGKEITDKEWFESILKTDKSYTYEEFQESDSLYKEPLASIANYLAKEEVTAYDSHKWIEQCMLFYNKEAGQILKNKGMGVLRRHSIPNLEKLEKYRANNIPELEKLAFSAAEYCLAEESETKHFGLESDNYAHTSSPIRRYADLVNQRVLKLYIRKSSEGHIVPIAMYDMNYRTKLNKNYSRDLDFLIAISAEGETTFKGIIIDKSIEEGGQLKLKIYVPVWKRTVTAKYKMVSDNIVLSRDEKREIDVSEFREVELTCAVNINSRNWKERIIINIS